MADGQDAGVDRRADGPQTGCQPGCAAHSDIVSAIEQQNARCREFGSWRIRHRLDAAQQNGGAHNTGMQLDDSG